MSDKERDTQPPAPNDTIPSSADYLSDSRLPAAGKVPDIRPNPHSWTDLQLDTLVRGMEELKEGRQDRNLEVERVIQKCADQFSRVLESHLETIRSQFKIEQTRTSTNTADIVTLREEMEALRHRTTAIELEVLRLRRLRGSDE